MTNSDRCLTLNANDRVTPFYELRIMSATEPRPKGGIWYFCDPPLSIPLGTGQPGQQFWVNRSHGDGTLKSSFVIGISLETIVIDGRTGHASC